MKFRKLFAMVLTLNLVASFAGAYAFAQSAGGEITSSKCTSVNSSSGSDLSSAVDRPVVEEKKDTGSAGQSVSGG